MNRRIAKAAVIGSGIMGGGIAALCASAGVKTLLLDIAPFNLTDEEKNSRTAKSRIVETGLQAQIKAKPAAFMDRSHDLALIETGNLTDDFEKLSDCDIIFEVVVENLKIKQDLFSRLEKIRKPGSIIASNTSGLPIAQMAEGRSRDFKEHFLITHFFNPVRYMKILEMIAGPETKKEVCDFTARWGEQILGKGIVWGKDTPNFIGNRIGMALICVALRLIDKEMISIPEADAIFSKPMGFPGTAIFGLTDFVGADTTDHIADNSYELLVDDEQREIYKTPKFFKEMMAKGMYGNKAKDKGGFYLSGKGPDGKKFKKVLDIKTLQHVDYDTKAVYPSVEAVNREAVAESRAKLEAALASMTDAVFISDAGGNFVHANEAFVTYHRFRNKEECSKRFADCSKVLEVFLPDGTSAPPEMWAVPRALRGERVSYTEYILRRKDTGETWTGS